MVERLFTVAAVEVDFNVPAEVDPADKAIIVRDFDRARNHVSLTSEVKFCTWGHLPLRCAGIADPDRALAIDAARVCIALYDSASPAERATMHRIVHKLLTPGCILRLQLEQFVAGADILGPAFRKLRHLLARFLLLRTCERSVEALHATTSKNIKLATHHGPAYLALRAALPLMLRGADRHYNEICRLGRYFSELTSNSRRAALSLGFWQPPRYTAHCRSIWFRRTSPCLQGRS